MYQNCFYIYNAKNIRNKKYLALMFYQCFNDFSLVLLLRMHLCFLKLNKNRILLFLCRFMKENAVLNRFALNSINLHEFELIIRQQRQHADKLTVNFFKKLPTYEFFLNYYLQLCAWKTSFKNKYL